MIRSSTSYNLRDAKVGSEVEVYGGYNKRSEVLTVEKVQLETKGYHAGRAKRVWLTDGSSWTGNGNRWGSTEDRFRLGNKNARLILDRALFDAERAEQLAAKRLKARREQLVRMLVAEAASLSDHDLETVATMIQLEGRVAARSVAGFAQALVQRYY